MQQLNSLKQSVTVTRRSSRNKKTAKIKKILLLLQHIVVMSTCLLLLLYYNFLTILILRFGILNSVNLSLVQKNYRKDRVQQPRIPM